MQIRMEDVLECLVGARKLLAHGFFPHFTKGIERIGDEVRHVVYAGSRFHPEVHEWAVDDALCKGAKGKKGVWGATEEFLRPLTGEFYSVMAYSLAPNRTQKEMLHLFDKAIDKAHASLKGGKIGYDSLTHKMLSYLEAE